MDSPNHFYFNTHSSYVDPDRDYARVYLRSESCEGSVKVSRKAFPSSKGIFVIFDQCNGDNTTHRYAFIYDSHKEAMNKIRSLRAARAQSKTTIKTSGVIHMWIHSC